MGGETSASATLGRPIIVGDSGTRNISSLATRRRRTAGRCLSNGSWSGTRPGTSSCTTMAVQRPPRSAFRRKARILTVRGRGFQRGPTSNAVRRPLSSLNTATDTPATLSQPACPEARAETIRSVTTEWGTTGKPRERRFRSTDRWTPREAGKNRGKAMAAGTTG